MSAFSGGWGIIINHKSHSTLSLNYTEGSRNSVLHRQSQEVAKEHTKVGQKRFQALDFFCFVFQLIIYGQLKLLPKNAKMEFKFYL